MLAIAISTLLILSLNFMLTSNAQPEPCQSLPIEDQDRTPSEYVDIAFELNRLEMFPQAKLYLECAIALQPDNAPAYYHLGYNQFATEEYGSAVISVSKAIKFNFSPLDWAYYIRARSNQYLGFYGRALADYTEAISVGAEAHLSTYYAYRGTLYTDLGEYEEGLEDYNLSIQLAPNEAELFDLRGRLFYLTEDYEKALSDFNQAIELGRPEYLASYHLARGNTYLELGNLEATIEDFSIAIELSPETDIYYYNRAVALEKQGQYQLALADYSAAIRLDEDGKANFYFTRARLHGRLGNCEEATSDFNRAVQMSEPESELPFSLEDILADGCGD